MEVEEINVKITLMGASLVGKTSIMLNVYNPQVEPTIGAGYGSRAIDINGRPITLRLWDCSGNERYRSLAALYIRDTEAIILVYDITNRESFEVLKTWRSYIKDYGLGHIPIVIAGNKQDCIDREEVDNQIVAAFAHSIGAKFVKISAKSQYGVNQMFQDIATKILSNRNNTNPGATSNDLKD